MGFIINFYIIFGTNLLTGGPARIAVFAYISVSQKKNIKRSPNGMKPSEELFWNKRDPEDLEWMSRNSRGGHEAGRRACPLGTPPPSWAPRSSTTYFFLLYIPMYPETNQEHHETLFPPPQPSIPVRSHLGAFFGAPPEGALITEGFYINTIASPMMYE